MEDQQIQLQIERYVKGELSDIEEDQLWIEFLKAPEWFDYFQTYLNLMALAKDPRYRKCINKESI